MWDQSASVCHRPTNSIRAGLGISAFNEKFDEHFNVSTKRINKVLHQLDESGSADGVTLRSQICNQPELWGLRVRFVTHLWNYIADDIVAYAASHLVDEDYRHVCVSPECHWHHAGVERVTRDKARGTLQKMRTTMRLVVDRYVRPWTKDAKAGLAIVLNSGYHSTYRKGVSLEDLCKATVFISHSWGDDFEDFANSLKFSLYMDTVAWICSFAVWQHSNISGLLCDLAECPFARALTSCDRVLVISNESMGVFDRCWVVLEAALAMTLNTEYHICFPDSGMTIREDIWPKLETLDLENCSASVASDKLKIISYAQEHLGGLQQLNARVRSTVKHAIGEAEVMLAAMHGDVLALQKDAGFLKTWRSMRGRSVVHLAAEYAHASSVADIVDAIGRDQIDVRDNNGSTPLSIAARNGALAGVACLLSLRADVNASAEGEGELTPLHFAVSQGHRKICQLLLASRADLRMEACYLDTNGRRPLDIAIREGYRDLVQDILNAAVDVNSSSSNGLNPLFVAAANDHASIVAMLFNAGANINARTKDEFGRTALIRAVMSGFSATAHLLLAQKADPYIEDNSGISATKLLDKIVSRKTESAPPLPYQTALIMTDHVSLQERHQQKEKVSYAFARATLNLIENSDSLYSKSDLNSKFCCACHVLRRMIRRVCKGPAKNQIQEDSYDLCDSTCDTQDCDASNEDDSLRCGGRASAIDKRFSVYLAADCFLTSESNLVPAESILYSSAGAFQSAGELESLGSCPKMQNCIGSYPTMAPKVILWL